MAGSFTDVGEKKILNYIFRDTAIGLDATNLWIPLFTTNPTDSTTGTEVSTSGTAYARLAVVRTGAGWNAATGTLALIDNTNALVWALATGNWGTLTGFGITISSAGALSTDLIAWADLTVSKAVTTGDTFSMAAGAFDITFD